MPTSALTDGNAGKSWPCLLGISVEEYRAAYRSCPAAPGRHFCVTGSAYSANSYIPSNGSTRRNPQNFGLRSPGVVESTGAAPKGLLGSFFTPIASS